MPGKEVPNEVDFSQFWTRVRIRKGEKSEIVTQPVFDDETFKKMFGPEALRAFVQFCCSKNEENPAKREQERQGAIKTVRQITGVHPQEIWMAGRKTPITDI